MPRLWLKVVYISLKPFNIIKTITTELELNSSVTRGSASTLGHPVYYDPGFLLAVQKGGIEK